MLILTIHSIDGIHKIYFKDDNEGDLEYHLLAGLIEYTKKLPGIYTKFTLMDDNGTYYLMRDFLTDKERKIIHSKYSRVDRLIIITDSLREELAA